MNQESRSPNDEALTRRDRRAEPRPKRRWRPSWLTWTIVTCGVLGLAVLLYPTASAWVTQYNQSQITGDYAAQAADADPDAAEQLKLAKQYNDALTSGVALEANANVPSGTGTSSDPSLDYDKMLSVDKTGLMARLMIPDIDVDLPIYHGTSDATLLRGAGHLEGSHLPIGGEGTHAVITAHRGLASARMFTDLDKVSKGDTFTIQVLGEVLTYQVIDTRVVEPDDTDSLRAVDGEDLVTLITCTPLGINTHRILVTGERITPTPKADLERADSQPDVPHFPWWLLILGGATIGLGVYTWRAGFTDAAVAEARRSASATRKGSESTESEINTD